MPALDPVGDHGRHLPDAERERRAVLDRYPSVLARPAGRTEDHELTAPGRPSSPEDARILAAFGLGDGDLIGGGGESLVYALGSDRILRLPRERRPDAISRKRLRAFLDRIAGRLPFATPKILEIGPGEAWTIEKRLPGRAMAGLLRELDGARREAAFRNYVAAIDAFRGVSLLYQPYGHVLGPTAVRATDWRAFTRASLAGFLARNRGTIAGEIGNPDALFAKAAVMIAALPEHPAKVLVHGDYFPGNVMLDDALEVSAVFDFGVFTVAGDPQLDLAVAYLTLELIDECRVADAPFVRKLIVARHGAGIEPAFRFYRAYLAFSMADPANAAPPYPRLYDWSLAQLRLLAEDRLPA